MVMSETSVNLPWYVLAWVKGPREAEEDQWLDLIRGAQDLTLKGEQELMIQIFYNKVSPQGQLFRIT